MVYIYAKTPSWSGVSRVHSILIIILCFYANENTRRNKYNWFLNPTLKLLISQLEEEIKLSPSYHNESTPSRKHYPTWSWVLVSLNVGLNTLVKVEL